MLNGLILYHIITIIFTLYGDYLIKRFNLESKYPKLVKLKKKLSNYTLKISLTWIVLCLLPQIYVNSMIVGIKLYEFIFSNF